jgi:hypothetical protein
MNVCNLVAEHLSMRKTHKNAIFNLIRENFNVNDFEIIENQEFKAGEGYLTGDTIKLKNTPFIFVVRISSENYNWFDYRYTCYSPKYTLTAYYPEQDFCNFDQLMAALKSWLISHVKAYQDDLVEPDLWEQFSKGNTLIDDVTFESQSEFSDDEKQKVLMSINELKYAIQRELKTTDEQQKLIVARMDYLASGMDRMNKYDWRGLALTTFIDISTILILEPDKRTILFDLFKKAFTYFILLT